MTTVVAVLPRETSVLILFPLLNPRDAVDDFRQCGVTVLGRPCLGPTVPEYGDGGGAERTGLRRSPTISTPLATGVARLRCGSGPDEPADDHGGVDESKPFFCECIGACITALLGAQSPCIL